VVLAVLFALLASLIYALASVLQHRAAVTQAHEDTLRLGLLTRLARHPLWLVGIACDVFAYGLQFVALGHGSLVLVQPLLVCGLLFALPLGAWLAGTTMNVRDWTGAVMVVVGLSAFLLAASPGRGNTDADSWPALIILTSVAVGGLVLAARGRRGGRARAGLLAAAAALIYGLTAALTKSVAHLLGIGVGHVLTSWELYVLIGAGLVGMVLAQSAFQAGPLDASLPVLTVVDPVVSIVIGALVLGEGVRTGRVSSPMEVLGLGVMTVGVVLLSKAEAVHIGHEESEESEESEAPEELARPSSPESAG
jgi:drug/metabolite transporter (DMT)-like permease